MQYAIKIHSPGLWCDGLYVCNSSKRIGHTIDDVLLFNSFEEADKFLNPSWPRTVYKIVEYNADPA